MSDGMQGFRYNTVVVKGREIGPGTKLLYGKYAGENFSGAHLMGANFSGADLTGADFRGSNLFEANLSFAKLMGAKLQGSNLRGANLGGADLAGAEFDSYTSFRGANIDNARVDPELFPLIEKGVREMLDSVEVISGRTPNPSTTKETGTYLVNGVGTVVVYEGYTFNEEYAIHPGADLSGAYLAEADLSGAKLDFAILRNASLRETDLRGASLVGANLFRATLDGANLEGANLTGATMPDGTTYSGRAPNPGYGHRHGYGRRR